MTTQPTDTAPQNRLVLTVDRDGWTNGIQLGISQLDSNDRGHGYRLAGPKYNGSSKTLLQYELTERDAREIREFLDAVFPQEPTDATAPASGSGSGGPARDEDAR